MKKLLLFLLIGPLIFVHLGCSESPSEPQVDPNATPTPTVISIQDFDDNNGTLNNVYFFETFNCSAARSGSAINYELIMTAESSAGYAYITVPPSSLDNYISKTLDISSATFIGMSVYDETTSGNHEISIYLYDRSGSETHIEGCVSSVRTTAKKWTTIEIPLANYEIIDLRNIEFIVPFVQGVNDQDVFHFDNIFIRN